MDAPYGKSWISIIGQLMMKILSVLLLATVCAGCMPVSQKSTVFVPASKLTSCMPKADACARKIIAKYNQERPHRDLLRGKDRTLSLDEYEKTVHFGRFTGRKYVGVMYTLKKRLPWLGHPNHFSVWIFIDNEEAVIHLGR